MYFATLTEVPILQGLLGSGMGNRLVAQPAQHVGDQLHHRPKEYLRLRLACRGYGHLHWLDLRHVLLSLINMKSSPIHFLVTALLSLLLTTVVSLAYEMAAQDGLLDARRTSLDSL